MDICITESLCCTPETNNIVDQLYSNIKKKFKTLDKQGPTAQETKLSCKNL